jgi:hypothetical protein
MSHFLCVWQIFDIPFNQPRLRDFVSAFHPALELGAEAYNTMFASLSQWLQDQSVILNERSELWTITSVVHLYRCMFPCTLHGLDYLSYELGPINIEAGDMVCVLFGYSFPVILRSVQGSNILLGIALVPKLMYGDAVEVIQEGKEQPMDFLIK